MQLKDFNSVKQLSEFRNLFFEYFRRGGTRGQREAEAGGAAQPHPAQGRDPSQDHGGATCKARGQTTGRGCRAVSLEFTGLVQHSLVGLGGQGLR